jgi:chorismate mutase-like protein
LYDLEETRNQIDAIDRKLLELLSTRAGLTVDIAKIKFKKNLPVFAPERENELLQKIIGLNTGPFDKEAVQNIFQTIMAESKRLQNTVITESGGKNTLNNE